MEAAASLIWAGTQNIIGATISGQRGLREIWE